MRAALLTAACVAAAGCSGYQGTARPFTPQRLRSETGWITAAGVPLAAQREAADCGAAALAMVVSYWTGDPPESIAAGLRPAPPKGHRAGLLRALARARGLSAFLIRGAMADLERELGSGRPVLVGLVKPQRRGVLTHYEVVVGLHPGRRLVVTLDPAEGWRQNSFDGFLAEWSAAHHLTLVVSGPTTGAAAGLFRSGTDTFLHKVLASSRRIVSIRSMQMWVVSARSASGEEMPLGLVEASGKEAALFRARSKVSLFLRPSDDREIIVRLARTDPN